MSGKKASSAAAHPGCDDPRKGSDARPVPGSDRVSRLQTAKPSDLAGDALAGFGKALEEARAKRHDPEVIAARRAAAQRSRTEAISIRKARPDSPERKAHRTRRIRETAPRDGFARMVDAGQIDARQAAAGWDLIRVLEAAEAGAMCMPDPDALKTGAIRVTGRKGAPQFAAIEGYVDRYIPFVKALSHPACRMGPKGRDGRGRYAGTQALDVVISVVVNGEGLRAVEKRMGVRVGGTAGGLLAEALNLYARRM